MSDDPQSECVRQVGEEAGAVENTLVPFTVAISDEELSDLFDRLRRTRWPEPEPVSDWSQGVPLGYLQELCAYWADGYDWRNREARINAFAQYKTMVDSLGVHFLHVRSPHEEALPLILTHGWPGSIIEFLEVIGPLTDPAAHGGDPADAFPPPPAGASSESLRPGRSSWAAWATTATAPRVATGGPG